MGAESAAIQAAPIAGAVVGGIGDIAKGLIGGRQRKEALDAIKTFQRQELTNIAEGLGVSTLGAELRTREAQRAQATAVNALRAGGARALVAGLPSVVRESNLVAQQSAVDLDRQQREIDMVRARDEATIRGIQENRENQELAALGNLANVGTQNLFGAIESGAQGLFSLGNIAQQNQLTENLSNEYFGRSTRPMVAPLNINTAGIASLGGYSLPS